MGAASVAAFVPLSPPSNPGPLPSRCWLVALSIIRCLIFSNRATSRILLEPRGVWRHPSAARLPGVGSVSAGRPHRLGPERGDACNDFSVTPCLLHVGSPRTRRHGRKLEPRGVEAPQRRRQIATQNSTSLTSVFFNVCCPVIKDVKWTYWVLRESHLLVANNEGRCSSWAVGPARR
jgi:hypothetical protein